MIKKSHKIKHNRRLSKLWMNIHFKDVCKKYTRSFGLSMYDTLIRCTY